MRGKFRLGALILALVLVVGLVVPLGTATSQGASINIGVIGTANSPTFRGVRLAVEQISRSGGASLPDGSRKPVGVIVVDAQTPDQVAAAINQLRVVGVTAIFGPDDEALAANSLATMSAAGVPVFTAAVSSQVRVGGSVFRTRANDTVRMTALADYLLTDLGAKNIAIYQGTSLDAPSATSALAVALANRGIATNPVLQDPSRSARDAAPVVIQNLPDTLVAFGTVQQVSELYATAIALNFRGRFVTNLADNSAFLGSVAALPTGGIIGVTNWTLNLPTAQTKAFVEQYLSAFGEAPTALSAAAYDAAVNLFATISTVGDAPASLISGLAARPSSPSLQGTFNSALGGGETSNTSVIFETNTTGGPRFLTYYVGDTRTPLDTGGVFVPPPVVIPTVPPFGPPTAIATPPPLVITATPDGVELTVLNDFVNVRYGPGQVYDPPLGRLPRGTKIRLLGANANYTWFTFNFNGTLAWVTGDPSIVEIFGNVRSLPVVQTPPTPTPNVTATFTPLPGPAQADLIAISAFLNPNPLKVGQPFSLTVTILNQGNTNAGNFAVAASFNNVFGATNIPGLAARQQITVVINYPGVPTAGTFKDAVVVDLNREVDEGPTGEQNNLFEITYQVVP